MNLLRNPLVHFAIGFLFVALLGWFCAAAGGVVWGTEAAGWCAAVTCFLAGCVGAKLADVFE